MTPEIAGGRTMVPAWLARTATAAVVSLLLCPAAHAQSRFWFASAHYESPWLVVPVVFLTSVDDEREWSLGLAGWTLSAEWKASLANRRKLHIVADVTPLNAHSSNYIYTSGRRDPAADYRNATIEAGGGLEIEHGRHWTGGYRLLALYENVDRAGQAVEQLWERPFAGVEITQRYTRVTSDELFGSRWDGLKAGLDAQMFTGARTWSRLQAHVGGGTRTGRFFVFGRAAGFAGRSLNDVSAFLVGGSWDLAIPGLLTGHRYAEFRLERAAVAGGAVDVALAGSWEAGARAGCLAAPRAQTCGLALQVTTVWNGAMFKVGAAAPVTDGGGRRPVVFGSLAVALVHR